jgi:hypothetical protein
MVNLFRYLLLVLKKYRALSHEQSSVSPETRRSSVDSVGETERVAKKCVPINNSSRRIVGYCSVCSRPLKSKRDPTKGLLHLTCKCGHETNIGTEVSSKKHRKKRPRSQRIPHCLAWARKRISVLAVDLILTNSAY